MAAVDESDDAPFRDRHHFATHLAYHTGAIALAGRMRAVLSRQAPGFSGHVELSGEQFATAASLRRLTIKAIGQVPLSRNVSVALSAQRQQLPWQELQLAVSLKWHHQPLKLRPDARIRSVQ